MIGGIRGGKVKSDNKHPSTYSRKELMDFYFTRKPRELFGWDKPLVLSEVFKKTRTSNLTNTIAELYTKIKSNESKPGESMSLLVKVAVIANVGWDAYKEIKYGDSKIVDAKKLLDNRYIGAVKEFFFTQNH